MSTMQTESQRPKGKDQTISSLNVAIEGLNLAKELSSVTPAKAVFGSASILLTMIKVSFFLFYDDVTQTHAWPGHHGQQAGLCRTRARLRRRMWSA